MGVARSWNENDFEARLYIRLFSPTSLITLETRKAQREEKAGKYLRDPEIAFESEPSKGLRRANAEGEGEETTRHNTIEGSGG